jgi:CheY-like chemotaxis protein
MRKVLVVEDHEPEMRLMVWVLTDDGSDVHVASTVGAVISHIEEHRPDTVVFNSRMLGQAKDACVTLIRQLHPEVRIIDVSTPPLAGEKRFIDVTAFDERDTRRSKLDDTALSGDGLVYMVNHRRTAR